MSLQEQANKNAADISFTIMKHTDEHQAVVIYDERCELSLMLVAAYQKALPKALFVRFYESSEKYVFQVCTALKKDDLVVLIQSTSFRMAAYRIRVEVQRVCVKVVEHTNLARIEPHQMQIYIDSIAYDPNYYLTVGNGLKQKMDASQKTIIESNEGRQLVFNTPLESAKLNTGNFEGMDYMGSTFPIGEVFSEAQDLERVSGEFDIYGFASIDFCLHFPKIPITIIVERGRIIDTRNSTDEFDFVLQCIRSHETDVWIRELGFGLNEAFSKEKTVLDVTTFERVKGVHLSIGAKHGVFKKPFLNARESRYHIDIFLDVNRVLIGDDVVFQNNQWTL